MDKTARATQGRQLEHPETAQISLEDVLSALADPIRLRIVHDLGQGHDDMACIAFELPVSKSTSTHHFRVLREAGIIRQYYEGTSRMSRLRTEDLEERFPGLLSAVLLARSVDAVVPGRTA
ncbi:MULTISPECIES: ArsR/SmtB family transcription factor [Actinoalloteichus]|uniref:Transcriptional regulator, ArsR family n=1 Tax=Actinoalloteichus fjordicus TaxID=1612552 RepID=A0AAC9LFA5_9PSEU|nr:MULTISPECIES: metalloregulator ArsR/SmtB family transcription factor [Actinoalloteichus]APU15164.1 transcriptional regulator, ArsR family [Actinoalloteichus fjordicus]APU21233.1 transcriptional regulator, ArsR family [Actinoalloteichus sp. GBA129-24]